MSGSLYAIGIGPGDPELLTLKAVKRIKESAVLCVPKGREEGTSLALSIVEKAVSLKGKEIIEAHFPMKKTRASSANDVGARHALPLLDAKWNETAERITKRIQEGQNVAFLTLGDPTIYSTFFYLYEKLLKQQPAMNIEIIPGVSSINASASRARISLVLGDEKIAVLPANYLGNLKAALETFDTIVLMKVNKVLNDIVRLLTEMGLVERAVCISRAGMDDEKIIHDIREIKEEELNYFSLIIVRK